MKKNKSNWFKKQALALSLALSNVEKEALHKVQEEDGNSIGTTQRVGIGTLADDLLQGRVTEQVKLFRASMYSALSASSNLRYSKNNGIIKINNEIGDDIYGEPSDEYKVEIVVDNTPITSDFVTSVDNINAKQEYPIHIQRSITPRFKLEEYTKKLYIKKYNKKTKLLEFFILKYPDIFNKTSILFLSSIKKAITNPRVSDVLDIDEISFISNNSSGVDSFLEFKYNNIEFHKIIEFNEFYVIKFKCDVCINGNPIFDKYKNEELEEKYKNKERRKSKRSDTFNG